MDRGPQTRRSRLDADVQAALQIAREAQDSVERATDRAEIAIALRDALVELEEDLVAELRGVVAELAAELGQVRAIALEAKRTGEQAAKDVSRLQVELFEADDDEPGPHQ